MAKELPYFQFEPAEYLTRDISFCSLSAQGLFINVCAYYWQRQCELTRTQFLRRLNHEKELNELVQEGIIDLIDDTIKIKFLDVQFGKATSLRKTNSSNGSKGGRPKKENPNKSELKANQNPNKSESISESKGIREDKIKENEIKTPPTPKGELKENVKKFISWYNSQVEKYSGKTGKTKTLSTTDLNNYKKLMESYKDPVDWNIAFYNMWHNQWCIDTNNRTATHLLRVDNFNKYLNQGKPEPKQQQRYIPTHTILDHD